MLLQYLVHTNQNFNLVLYFGLLLSAVKKIPLFAVVGPAIHDSIVK